MTEIARWGAGAALAALVAGAARRTGALSASGAVAAAALGTLAAGAGWDWAVLLVVYFASSTALSRVRPLEREARTAGRVEKGGPRDAVQVLANGGLFGCAAAGFILSNDAVLQSAGAAALAASAADTWATEIGTLSTAAPRSIRTGRPVPAGTSGGVSAQGTAAAVAGAAFVALVVVAIGWPGGSAIGAFVAGTTGATLDSVLGATIQARRYCPACDAETEQRLHGCGAPTTVTGGVAWIGNDAVNALSILGGVVAGILVARVA